MVDLELPLSAAGTGFVDYFKLSTPVEEIGALNIGSRRPSSRKQTDKISDLRAMAWSLSRVMLPGFYGTGTAFERWVGGDPARLQRLRELYRDLAVLPVGALEHGAGAGQIRSRPGRAVPRAGARSGAA